MGRMCRRVDPLVDEKFKPREIVELENARVKKAVIIRDYATVSLWIYFDRGVLKAEADWELEGELGIARMV